MNKYINTFDENLLFQLEQFLNFEDEVILNFYNNKIIEKNIDKNEVSKIFKDFEFNGGEGGIEPTNGCPVAGFQDQCFQPLSHLSLKLI